VCFSALLGGHNGVWWLLHAVPEARHPECLNVVSLNVSGARELRKRAFVFEMAKMKHIDVLFLQETHSDVGNEADWSREWEGELILSHNTTLSGGVGFLFSRGFTPTSVVVRHVVEGRCLLVKAQFEHFNVVLINIYAPNNGTERKRSFENLNYILNSCSSEDYLFVGGDFNCTDNEILDRNHAEPHAASQHALRQLVSSHGLADVWRRIHTGCRQYTWSHVSENRISSARLDRFYVFKHRVSVVRMCKISFLLIILWFYVAFLLEIFYPKAPIGILTLF